MIKLIEIEPREYDPKRKRVRFWKYEFYKKPTISKLREICGEKLMDKEPEIYEIKEGIVYHYPDKPKLIIHAGRICVPEEDLKSYGEEQCRQQASILLRLLYYPKRKRKLLRAERKTVTYARLNFLSSVPQIDETKKINGLSITLVRAGEYKPDKYYRVGFDIAIKNYSNRTRMIELDPTALGPKHKRRFPMKTIKVKPNETKEAYFYTPRLRETTGPFSICINYSLERKKKGTLWFLT